MQYRSVKIDVAPLRARIVELARLRLRYGFRRIHVLLRREGWAVNVKRVHRLYRQEGLSMRLRPPKRRRAAAVRLERRLTTAANQSWSMDFLPDTLADGRRIRFLAIVDNFTRENFALDVGFSFKAARVVDVLRRIVRRYGAPRRLQVDNGPDSSLSSSTSGRTGAGSNSIFRVRESRLTMPLSSRSTTAFVRSSLTPTGLHRSLKRID